jgi:SOS-response transcriptional repressor LexA
MNKMNTLEAQEAYKMLEEAGMKPQWCDTPVPCYDATVQAGIPTDPGDISLGEQLMMAQNLSKGSLTFCVYVRGESMKDADILDGDQVEMLSGAPVKDGDIVIAEIDREYTLKSFYVDEQGNKWLVPANKAFKPILLTEEMGVRFLGKVVRVVKDAPRVPYAELMKWVKETRDGIPSEEEITEERVEQVICEMGDEVKEIRKWYAVFRALVDAGVYDPFDYVLFADKVAELLPMHKRLPVVPELRRMASLSFRKKVSLWRESDAPVHGHHFRDYLRLAKLTEKKLRM